MHISDIAEKAKKMAAMDEEEAEGNELVADIKEKLQAARDADIERINAEYEAREQEPPEIDPETHVVPIPDDSLYKLLKLRLQENDCRNRGYILDGYPRNFYDCQNVFLKLIKKPDPDDPENMIEYEEPEQEEGETKKEFPPDWFIPDDAIFPSSVILLQQDDGFLINRVKNLDEDIVAGSHYTPHDMKRRLKTYRDANESKVADKNISDFFNEAGWREEKKMKDPADEAGEKYIEETIMHNCAIPVFARDAAEAAENVWQACKIFIERDGKPKNFVFGEESDEAKRRILLQMQRMVEEETKRLNIILEEGIEKELKKQKEAQIKQNIAAIRQDEKDQLNEKSQPIRYYLQKNLTEILTDGLI